MGSGLSQWCTSMEPFRVKVLVKVAEVMLGSTGNANSSAVMLRKMASSMFCQMGYTEPPTVNGVEITKSSLSRILPSVAPVKLEAGLVPPRKKKRVLPWIERPLPVREKLLLTRLGVKLMNPPVTVIATVSARASADGTRRKTKSRATGETFKNVRM